MFSTKKPITAAACSPPYAICNRRWKVQMVSNVVCNYQLSAPLIRSPSHFGWDAQHKCRHFSQTLVRLPQKAFKGCFEPLQSRKTPTAENKKGHPLTSVSGATVRVDGREGAQDRVQPLQQHHGPLPEDQGGLHPRGRPDEVRPAAGLQAHGRQLRRGEIPDVLPRAEEPDLQSTFIFVTFKILSLAVLRYRPKLIFLQKQRSIFSPCKPHSVIQTFKRGFKSPFPVRHQCGRLLAIITKLAKWELEIKLSKD